MEFSLFDGHILNFICIFTIAKDEMFILNFFIGRFYSHNKGDKLWDYFIQLKVSAMRE